MLSAQVNCGLENELVNVRETETCVYRAAPPRARPRPLPTLPMHTHTLSLYMIVDALSPCSVLSLSIGGWVGRWWVGASAEGPVD